MNTKENFPIKFNSTTREQTISIGKRVGSKLIAGMVVALQGPLGAGKTTLVKGIALSLGIIEQITSPTFIIISEYSGKYKLYHVDLYRLQCEQEAYDLGLEEIIYGQGITLIEWPEKIQGLLPKDAIKVMIEINNNGERKIKVWGINI
jgi:tRNA threonylcarbamoyladenosine biosynthesis protein TsaE